MSGPRLPIRLGLPGRSSHADTIRCHFAAVGDSMNLSAATVGAQYGPAASGGSGSGMPGAISPAAAADLQDQAEPAFVDAGEFGQPFDLAYSEPATTKFGNRCGAECFEKNLDLAQKVDRRPGRHGVHVGGRGGRHLGSGVVRLTGPGRFAAQHLADESRQDHRLVVEPAQQTGG